VEKTAIAIVDMILFEIFIMQKSYNGKGVS